MTAETSDVHTFARTDITFASGDSECSAWVYRPDGVAEPPVVILGHGLGGTREMRLDAFASRFAEHGFAAVVFTYRNFGTSGGEPRQLISIPQQHEDWDAAIAWTKAQGDFDTTRIAIWGTSFGGGHAIAAASRHPELRAAVAQCPFTDGRASALTIKPLEQLKVFPILVRDLLASVRRTTPHMVPLAGPPGTAALMTAPDALPGMEALVSPGDVFVNETPARVLPTIVNYRPGASARDIEIPILLFLRKNDSVAPTSQTLKFAATAPQGQTKVYDIGHFDFYSGDPFERAIADQIEFLDAEFARTRSPRSAPLSKGKDMAQPIVTGSAARLFLALLITGRLTLAVTTVLAPHRALQVFQIPGDGTPAPALFRMFGIRNGGLGVGLLRLGEFKNPRAFVALNIVMDIVDGLGFFSAKRRGEFGTVGSSITLGLAGAATVAGAIIYSGTQNPQR